MSNVKAQVRKVKSFFDKPGNQGFDFEEMKTLYFEIVALESDSTISISVENKKLFNIYKEYFLAYEDYYRNLFQLKTKLLSFQLNTKNAIRETEELQYKVGTGFIDNQIKVNRIELNNLTLHLGDRMNLDSPKISLTDLEAELDEITKALDLDKDIEG